MGHPNDPVLYALVGIIAFTPLLGSLYLLIPPKWFLRR